MTKTKDIKLDIFIKIVLTVLFFLVLVFVSAGTLDWPEAWLFMFILLGYGIPVGLWLKKHDPVLLKKRMELDKPVKTWDRIIMAFSSVFFIAALFVAGFDAIRYRWSQIPLIIESIAFIGIFLSFVWVFLVIKENTYLSRIVEVQKKRHHKVITTGPYSYVRHPMYVAVVLMTIFIPIALGSWYALIPSVIAGLFMVARTYFEDKMLQKELVGYKAYAKKVRYRLVPGLW